MTSKAAATRQPTNVLPFPGAGKPASRAKPGRKAPADKGTTNITDAWIKAVCEASRKVAGRREYRDAHQAKLYVRVSNGVATYSVFTRVQGYANPQRVTLGTNAELNVKAAR
jgi:hypothetical protein